MIQYLLRVEKQEPAAEAGVDKHVLLRFCQHIASGMSYLSLKAFVHRDLAARNILVSGDKTCKVHVLEEILLAIACVYYQGYYFVIRSVILECLVI